MTVEHTGSEHLKTFLHDYLLITFDRNMTVPVIL